MQVDWMAGIWFNKKIFEETRMSRITVEDCLNQVSSRFELVMLASKEHGSSLRGRSP